MIKGKRILCYLDNDRGRDAEMMLPLVYFIENVLECTVEFAFVWDVHAIYRKKPDLVLLPNAIGSPLNYQISKYAYNQNLRVFALISEGNFRTDGTFKYWGYNKDKVFYEDFICLWSKRTYDFLSEKEPDHVDKMVVTGGVGFDRYKIYSFKSKEEFLQERGLSEFRKIIGYAGWAFGKVFNKQGLAEIAFLRKNDPNRVEWMKKQMYLVEDILRNCVEANPDTLFIFKRHPNEANPSIVGEGMNEMLRLKDYPNVLYVKEEVNIHDLINISDIWMAFESTTALESWVMRETHPTILINPDPEFKRDKLHVGSVIAKGYPELQKMIDEYYATGTIKEFFKTELIENRSKLIKDTIGFGDGFNHIRTGLYLSKSLEKADSKQARFVFSFNYYLKFRLLHIVKYFYIRNLFEKLPKFKKTVWLFERYTLENINVLKQQYWPYLSNFYNKNSIKQQYQDRSLSQNLKIND